MATVLITGANRGIGLGLARELHDRGATVIGTTRSLDGADELTGLARVEVLDVTDPGSVRALRDTLAADGTALDVLVNNAGWAAPEYARSMAEVDLERDQRTFAVNAVGTMRVLQELAGLLAPGATVLNLSSRLASFASTTVVNDPVYAASKAAVNMLTRQLALDDAFRGRCLVSVSPGWVRTRMGGSDAALSVEESAASLANLVEKLTPEDTGQFLNYDGTVFPW